jgi:gliding motility-associated-like protein
MKILKAIFFSAVVLFSITAKSQSNDCSTATPIAVTANCASPTAGTSLGATQSIPGCVGTADDDVWYSFVATGTSHQINVTASGGYDPVVQLFANGCGTLSSLYCQDNFGNGGAESINATGLTIGVTYRIRIYHYGVGSGTNTFTLCVTNPPAAPANNNCAGATSLTVNAACVNTASTTVGATQSEIGCAGTADDDVWFSFVATNAVQTITVNPSVTMDPVVELFSGTCASHTSITCMDLGFTDGNEVISALGLTPGQTYFIRVYDYYSGTGGATFTICVTGTATAIPTNNEPCTAIALPTVTADCNYLQFTTTGATASMGAPTPASCGGTAPFTGDFTAASADVWFSVTVPANGNIYVTSQPGFGIADGVMALYTGACGSLTQVSCNDDFNYPGAANDLKPYIAATGLTPGATVYIRYWGYGTTQGNFGLCVTTPTNDACANALNICDLDGYAGSTSAAYTADRPCNMFANNETAAGVNQPDGINTGGIFGQGGPWGTGSPFFDVNLNNNSWITFTASSTTATLTVNISDCWVGNYPSGGIQMQIFSGTGCCAFTPVSNFEESSTGFVITANGLTLGNTYYLMIDGYAGDICNYTISANSGVLVGDITFTDDDLCFGENTTLTAPAGASSYLWSPGGQITQSINVTPGTTTTYTCEVEGFCGNRLILSKTISVSQPPSTSFAGGDQIICRTSGTGTMAATAPAIGTGTWTLVSGPSAVTISSPNSATSNISGMTTAGTYIYQWTITSGPCTPTTDQMQFTVNPPPSVANAGTATPVCINTTGNLSATVPGVGTGTWTQQSGPAAATITTPGSAATTVTGLSVAGNYVFLWTVSNSPCANSTSTVTLTVNPLPTISVFAAPSLTICPSGSTTLTASGGSTYVWSPATGLSATTGTNVTASPASTQTYTITGTNVNGCVNTTTSTVTVQDLIAPTITCPANSNVIVNGACSFTIPNYTSLATVSDNCTASGSIVVTQSPVAGTVLSGFGTTQVITLTANDGNGNTNTCNFTITLTDNIAPSITCPVNQNVVANASCQFSLANYTAMATVTDNCTASGSIVVTQSPVAGTLVSGTQVVTLTANDGHGNTSTCTFSVIVTDNTVPTISVCAPNQTGNTNASCQFSIPNYMGLITVTDNCTPTGSLTIIQNPVVGTLVGIGTTPIVVTVTDANGNSSVCNFNLVVTDITGPTVACPANQNIILNGSCAGTIPDYTSMATVTDNCTASGSIIVTQSPVVGTPISGAGTIQVITLTATDGNGNSSTCNFNATAVDNTIPTITCPANQNVTANASCQFTLADYTSMATVSDNCTASGVITVTQSPAIGSLVSGTQIVTLTANDGNGNIANCTFSVIVTDNTAPTISVCPSNQTGNTNATCQFSIPNYMGLITTSDNCTATGALTITQNPVVGTLVGIGTTPIVITVADANGNSSICNFNVVVTDITGPTLTCPTNQNIILNGSCAGTIPDYTSMATVTDNCTASGSIIVTQSPVVGTPISGAGTIQVITLTATDGNGNSSTCNFNATAVDNTIPTITCPANQNVTANASCQFTLADYTSMATVSDNCTASGVITVTQSPAIGSLVSGTQNVTLTANDGNGNTSTCNFSVIVSDNTNPTISFCAPNQTGNTNASCQFSIPDYTGLITASDNCTATGSLTITQNPIVGTNVGVGTTNVVVTVTDANGNISTCNFNVVVTDITGPLITCPASQNIFNDPGTCDATIPDYTSSITVADNCTATASIVITQSPIAGTIISGNGTTQIVTITATDGNGNSSNCNFTITVTDNEDPQVSCPANQNVASNASCQYVLLDYTSMSTITDNCTASGSIIVTQSPIAGTTLSGNQTITITADDGNGNTSSCTFDVTVTDNTLPTLVTCAPAQSGVVDATCNFAVGDYTSLVSATDNCTSTNNLVITQNPIAGTLVGTGITNVVITITDQSGNAITCNVALTVTDNTSPVFSNCPADIISCNPVITFTAPVGTDNCSGATTIQTDVTGLTSGSTFPIGTTTITYTSTDAAGNISTCSFDVTVNATPTTADVGLDITMCDSATIANIVAVTPTSGTGQWNVLAGGGVVNDVNSNSTFISSLSLGQNILEWIVSTASCGSDVDTLIITLEKCDEFILNTGFTPDGDGTNDVWEIPGLHELYPNNRVEIYGRWGGLVFESDGYAIPWDGTNRNKRLPIGSYYFVIDFGDEVTEPIKGTVTLIGS